ncbi:DedA family protein [Litorimonas haliclonae]|uniref:DedA family protein n=1 Tax=Litorimonas haliclonae TaxID=2081977 RepID=UPI0039EE65AC
MFDWILQIIQNLGYFGLAFLMLLENVFPPIPSELVMPLAGFLAAQGKFSVWAVIFAGSAGSLAGAVFWFYIGQVLGRDRLIAFSTKHGRWIALAPSDIERAENWFHRHGKGAVFIGRLIPGVRSLISVPAGIAKMNFTIFLLYSAIGTLLWTAILTGAGYILKSQYEKVEAWLNPISWLVIGAFIAWYIYGVMTFDKRHNNSMEK